MSFRPNGAAAPTRNYQEEILPGVSRTFALTIPELPGELRDVVTNAYLLCRIADTIEDECDLPPDQVQAFHDGFVAVVRGQADPQDFANKLVPALAPRALQTERELVENTARVLDFTYAFNENQRKALSRCVATMCHGMPGYQRNKSLAGLKDQAEMDRYCYYVAGCVGEMLAELFCDYAPEIARNKPELMRLAPSFGQGLQMTNILKDVWDDQGKGVCWLPRETFARAGFDLSKLDAHEYQPGFGEGYKELLAVAHAHLRNALEYTLLIPAKEAGIRRFCLWALGMAILTLRKIHRYPRFTDGRQVKITRRTVKATIVATNLCARSDLALKFLFNRAASGLPLAQLDGWLHPAADEA